MFPVYLSPRGRRVPQLQSATKTLLIAATVLLTACHQEASNSAKPLTQRGYLWQRSWSSALVDALTQAEKRLDGVVILGAEIEWTGSTPKTVWATIDWETLKKSKMSIAIGLRLAPFPGPFSADDIPARQIAEAAKSLIETAKAHAVKLSEFQLDFDCAQKRLAGYRVWLHTLQPVIHPIRFVVTALPAWLDEPDFVALIHDVDGYVLQVHSVLTSKESGRAVLCDTGLARQWVDKAAKLGLPFSVALPTYRCLAGYDSAGKLLGVAMDSVDPAWPPGTHVLDFRSDAEDVARLVKVWQSAHPPELRELLWYRVPVATDARNWRWATLSAVMDGRTPLHKLEVLQAGNNPVDLSISNTGEADEQHNIIVTVTWSGASLVACDALPGWTVRIERERAVFTPAAGFRSELPPGGQRSIGWLRYDRVTTVQSQAEELVKAHL